jgi:hypothetical protein
VQIASSIGLVLLGIAIAYGMSKLDPEERLDATQEIKS